MHQDNPGFTLLEVLIAMAILVVALASILMVESGSIRATTRAKQMSVVGMLARNLMIDTEFKIQDKPFDEISKETSGKFDAPYAEYTWKTSVKELKFPQLNALGSTATGAGGAGAQNPSGSTGTNQQGEMVGRVITNFLSKAIREVTVSIIWKKGTAEQSYSVSTYWVDLNYELSLTE